MVKNKCYNITLYNMINGLNDIFSQDTLSVIRSIGNVLQLKPTNRYGIT